PFATLPQVIVSAKAGSGMEELRQAIHTTMLGDAGCENLESVLLSDRRHREALVRAAGSLERVADGLRCELAPELLALETREALSALGQITGETTPDEVLDLIFSRFCIGK
ncbi:MAG: tRNA uridine-5-carboxymethylaminomethyl(34) synthesis GTPase MnmE, partial [Desulfuromonadales bacterium]|nr:tRNA uridine-5-carboxymethylaminomethyl(34) synthesis GTPase MnmE [Desulfuromonadales bacterium]